MFFKQFILLITILTNTLFASESFWHKLIEVENTFFNQDTILELIKQDNNRSIVFDKNETSSLLDKQFISFSSLINLLKNNPYSLDINGTLFIDSKKVNREIKQLTLKIDTNKKYGYIQAVQRDTMKLKSLQLKKQVYNFFDYMAKNWTLLEENMLKKYITDNKKQLHATINLEKSIEHYNNIKSQSNIMSRKIQDNFFLLSQDYYFFDSFLNYLQLNSNLFNYRSLSNQLQLDNLIDYINQKSLSKNANLYLRYLKTDTGRLFLFFVVILFFIIVNYLIYRRLYNYFKAKILEEENDTDYILLANLNRIRIPISLLINGIGLQLALEILNYPDNLADKTHLYFSIFFIVIVAYIIMQIIENVFFIYFHSSSSRNITLRTELINLILSVSKFLIFLVAVLIAFIKMGINISGVIASLGIGGLAVALAAKDTLSNFFGLIKIIFDESFSQGDWIKTADVEGTVVEIGFISTKIRTFDNAMITVPNEKLANTSLKNWSRRTIGRRIKLYVGVTYNSNQKDIQNAINQINSMLLKHEDISTPEKIDKNILNKHYRRSNKFVSLDNKLGIKSSVMVYLDGFSDSSMDILIYTFSKTTNWQKWLAVKEDILYKIWDILEANNLEFAFPSQSIYIEKTKEF
jgi:MscS family membrane protein